MIMAISTLGADRTNPPTQPASPPPPRHRADRRPVTSRRAKSTCPGWRQGGHQHQVAGRVGCSPKRPHRRRHAEGCPPAPVAHPPAPARAAPVPAKGIHRDQPQRAQERPAGAHFVSTAPSTRTIQVRNVTHASPARTGLPARSRPRCLPLPAPARAGKGRSSSSLAVPGAGTPSGGITICVALITMSSYTQRAR
jgi:hypothetical protein